jgi:hypothetical protein
MASAMIGLLFLIAASAQPSYRPSPPAAVAVPIFQPTSRATARATASIRILNAASFGQGIAAGTEGAQRRKALLEDSAGNSRNAELLEFQ